MKWRGTCLISGVNYARLTRLGAASLACFFLGCSSSPKSAQTTASDGRLFAVTADSAGFFHHGPRQGVSPDGTLAKDTLVKLIRPSFGYSKVQVVATGEQGYVSSEEIKPAAASMMVASVTTRPDVSVPSRRVPVFLRPINSISIPTIRGSCLRPRTCPPIFPRQRRSNKTRCAVAVREMPDQSSGGVTASIQVFYEGNVQGVGFRYSIRQIAKGFDITGSVRNLRDGRVELLATGEDHGSAGLSRSHRAKRIARPHQEAFRSTVAKPAGFSRFRDST